MCGAEVKRSQRWSGIVWGWGGGSGEGGGTLALHHLTHITSREEFHDQVEVNSILERVVHLHDPRVVSLHQDIPLSLGVGNLVKSGKNW